jgi:hypothetical protein
MNGLASLTRQVRALIKGLERMLDLFAQQHPIRDHVEFQIGEIGALIKDLVEPQMIWSLQVGSFLNCRSIGQS